MASPDKDRACLQIARQLETLLQQGRLKKVFIAKSTKAPPMLAFQVGFPRLSVTLAGGDEMELDRGDGSERVIARAHEAVFIAPNAWNKPTWSKVGTTAHFLLGKNHLGVSLVRHKGMSCEPSHQQTLVTHCDMGGPIPLLLNTIAGLAEERDVHVLNLLVEALIQSCVTLLQTPALTNTPLQKAQNTYNRICFYLQANFDKPLTRDSVAEHFRLSPNHLSRLFRRQGLMNFVDYLTWVRIDRAKSLLRHRELTLDEVSARCGYTETAYFCRVFKGKTKQTPTEYRLLGAV